MKTKLEKEMSKLILERRELLKKEDMHEISRIEYEEQLKVINDKYKRLTDIKIKEMEKTFSDRTKKQESIKTAVKTDTVKTDTVKTDVQTESEEPKLLKENIIDTEKVKQEAKEIVEEQLKKEKIKKLKLKKEVKEAVKAREERLKDITSDDLSSTFNRSINSNEDLILKALSHPSIDTESKAAAIIMKWNPEIIEVEIRKEIKKIINFIKRKNPKRFYYYEWDEKEYRVRNICQTKLF